MGRLKGYDKRKMKKVRKQPIPHMLMWYVKPMNKEKSVFNTKEDAERYMDNLENKHFSVLWCEPIPKELMKP